VGEEGGEEMRERKWRGVSGREVGKRGERESGREEIEQRG
jgi:hypothetical protein